MDKELKVINPEENLRKSKDLIAKAPTIIAYYQNIRDKKPLIYPNKDLGHAANFLYMLKGKKPDKIEEEALDRDFLLHTEHTLNASTFSARLSASTFSDIYAALESPSIMLGEGFLLKSIIFQSIFPLGIVSFERLMHFNLFL